MRAAITPAQKLQLGFSQALQVTSTPDALINACAVKPPSKFFLLIPTNYNLGPKSLRGLCAVANAVIHSQPNAENKCLLSLGPLEGGSFEAQGEMLKSRRQ